MLNNDQKVVYALLNYRKGLLLKTMEILNSVDEDRYREMKEVLLGNLYYKKYIHSSGIDKIALDKSIEHYLKVLKEDKDNKVAVNNLAIALIRTVHDKDMEKVYASYAQRYPDLDDMKYSILKLKVPVLDENYLWKCLLMQPDDSFNPLNLIKHTLIKFISYPFMYFLLVFFLYAKFIKKLFRLLGTSTKCSKCSKIINKKNIHKSYNLCNDCHQLFLIKDVIFLEAKLLKEKEIKKKNLRLFMKIILSSIFIPGLNLNFKQKNNLFVVLSVFLYFFLIFGLTGFLGFKSLGLSVPYIFNISGIIAAILYFVINIFSIKGEDYGI
jgi:DNA-directed RNA polymerase subunit RPC12/RpoP